MRRAMLKRHGSRRLRWPRFSVSRISLGLGACGLVFILGTAGLIAWREREIAYREARGGARDRAFSLADHAARLFEVADLALRNTALALGDRSWEEAEASRPLWNEMRLTAEVLPYVGDLWLNDAAGRLRLSTPAFPTPPSNGADRPVFAAVRDGAADLQIGDPILGRVTNRPTFLIARRLAGADGAFRGMVSATADLAYFIDYWHRVDLPNGEEVSLLRPSSGRVLVRFPEPEDEAAEPGDDTLREAVAAEPSAGRYKPAEGRTGYYHRVGDLPLYVAVSFRYGAIERAWRNWLWTSLPIPAALILALAAVMALARRQSRVEALASRDVKRARAALAAANERLERRVAERTADLEHSNAEIQRFAYIVSHDLRAPLVNIMGFTSELQRLRPALFPEPGATDQGTLPQAVLREDFDEAIGFIQSSIDKMDRLIRAILLLARQGTRVFEPEPVDTEALMRSIADSVAHRAQACGAEIVIEPLPRLVIDRIAAEQVFANLVDNAVKYLRPGVPGRVAVSATVAGNRAAFRVADNGRGIAPSDHGRVFELFRRSGAQDRPGDGIGLAHVRTLVRQLGGTISLESTPGEGTAFTVVLPLAPHGAAP